MQTTINTLKNQLFNLLNKSNKLTQISRNGYDFWVNQNTKTLQTTPRFETLPLSSQKYILLQAIPYAQYLLKNPHYII